MEATLSKDVCIWVNLDSIRSIFALPLVIVWTNLAINSISGDENIDSASAVGLLD